MRRYIFGAVFIFFFILGFGVIRILSQEDDKAHNKNLEQYNNHLVEHISTLREFKRLLDRYEIELDKNKRMEQLVKQYILGYAGMYKHLQDQGKTSEEIEKIIKENTEGIDIELHSSGAEK